MGTVTLAKRFWDKVQIDPDNLNGCWLWTACKDRQGYGFYGLDGKNMRPHKLVFEAYGGQLSEDRPIVMHLCNNSSCVNPKHLSSGTHSENIRESVRIKTQRNARKTHCHNGHELTGDNLSSYHLRVHGRRQCRVCDLLRWRRMHMKTKPRKEI